MPLLNKENLSKEDSFISHQERVRKNGHEAKVLWFSGLSGSGKSTIAKNLEKKLFLAGKKVYVLDGDNVRSGLCNDLSFSHEDRSENLRRVAEVAKLFADAGFIIIVAFISPYAKDRHAAKEIIGKYFNEIYIKAPIATCKTRDPKGLYKKAENGEIKNFTGISDIYEEPKNPDLVIETDKVTIEEAIENFSKYLSR